MYVEEIGYILLFLNRIGEYVSLNLAHILQYLNALWSQRNCQKKTKKRYKYEV